MEITLNRKRRLYVIPCGSGFTCLGFDVAEKRRRALWEWVGQECPAIRPGSKRHYADYRAALAAASQHSDSLRKRGARDWRCNVELLPALIGLEGRRVEVSHNGERRRFTVGKSTGWLPIHLEIANSRSTGGFPACIFPEDTVRVIR